MQTVTHDSVTETALNGRPSDLAHELEHGFAGRLIRRKSRQVVGKACISSSDREDIEQELRMALLACMDRFDPQRAHWNAFVLAVIDRQVSSILRARRAQKRKHRENVLSLSMLVAGEEGLPTELSETLLPRHQEFLVGEVLNDDQAAFALAEDLAQVVAQLPPELRQICELRQTMSVTEIARHLGIGRSTVVYRCRKIAVIFASAGLQNYLTRDW